MNNHSFVRWGAVACCALALSACATHYEMASIERTRLLVDDRYDAAVPSEVKNYLKPFQDAIDEQMNRVVGRVARDLEAKRPESPLSNLMADMLMWAAEKYGEHPDFSVYNIGGMRATIAAGDVTVGHALAVAPFENKICFLTLKGDKVLELFSQIALQKGEGVSGSVRLVVTPDWKLASVTINGEPVNPNASYRVATLDYVAQGNDKMVAFKSGTNLIAPKEEENNTRFLLMDYLTNDMKKGVITDSQVEGRIVIAE